MRVSYILLVAAAALLANSNAASIADQTKLSKVNSLGDDVSAPALDSDKAGRFLRARKVVDVDDDDDAVEGDVTAEVDEDNDDEEERSPFGSPAWDVKWMKKAQGWLKQGKTPGAIDEKLRALNGHMSEKNEAKLRIFTSLYKRKHGL